MPNSIKVNSDIHMSEGQKNQQKKTYINDLWVVIPAFNESGIIQQTIKDLKQYYTNLVVVDDGSIDDTSKKAESEGAYVIKHAYNLGQGAALQTGIDFSIYKKAKYICSFDADGQHDPKDIMRMVDELISADVDICLASRFLGKVINIPRSRYLLLKVATFFTKLSYGLQLTDTHNGLRVFTAETAKILNIEQARMSHASEILYKVKSLNLKYKEVPVTISYSEYSLRKGQSIFGAISIIVDTIVSRLIRG